MPRLHGVRVLLLHHSSSERALVGGHARALRQLSLHIAPGQRAPFGIRRCTEVNVRSAGVHGFSLARGVPSLQVHPLLRRAQRLNVIARGVVERQRETAGTLITSAQRARRTLGADAPVSDGTSCDVKA